MKNCKIHEKRKTCAQTRFTVFKMKTKQYEHLKKNPRTSTFILGKSMEKLNYMHHAISIILQFVISNIHEHSSKLVL